MRAHNFNPKTPTLYKMAITKKPEVTNAKLRRVIRMRILEEKRAVKAAKAKPRVMRPLDMTIRDYDIMVAQKVKDRQNYREAHETADKKDTAEALLKLRDPYHIMMEKFKKDEEAVAAAALIGMTLPPKPKEPLPFWDLILYIEKRM